MQAIIFQVVIPFILSLLIVIIVTVIAEKYGTKVGGIIGTLPSTIIIAFIFISYNKGVDFASEAASVVPAELGINILFAFIFALLAYRSMYLAFGVSFLVWGSLSAILFFLDVTNIYISIVIYSVSLLFSFLFLEYYKKIPSVGKVQIHYTFNKIIFRGVIAGTIISISVLLSNYGAVLSGIFSVFPAIFSSTMFITLREHGPEFAAGITKSIIFGVSSVCSYAILIHFLYPLYGVVVGTILAFIVSFIITLILFKLRNKIR